MKEKKKELILASASPRRRELLLQIGLEHIVVTSGCEETITKTEPEEIVMELSRQKAEAVYRKQRKKQYKTENYILAADTIVAKDGRIYGKPSDVREAGEMIASLKNAVHQVYTGVSILRCEEEDILDQRTFFDRTDVFVKELSRQEIDEYLKTGEADDKAGAYGIQGSFAKYIRKIDGDYTNVVGLPLSKVYDQLKDMGFFMGGSNEEKL